MVETYFPDGTTLSSLAPNTANLLAGITPTFSGFTTNPATNAQIVDELNGDACSTDGYIPASTSGKIKYDLGSSKRIVAYMQYYYAGVISRAFIKMSDDDSTWYSAYTEDGAAGAGIPAQQDVNASAIGKCRYVEFWIRNKDASFGSTLNAINLRAYQL